MWNNLVSNIEISLLRDKVVKDDVEFNWQIVEIGFDYMKIKVTWTDPAAISSGDVTDELKIKIDARVLNIGTFSSVYEFTAEVPKQTIE